MTEAHNNGLIVRPLLSGDARGWRQLYTGYAAFYQVEVTDQILSTTWSWLLDDTHQLEGLIVQRGDELIAFAHFRAQPKPLLGEYAGFLDDLFVLSEHRGLGAARMLINEIRSIALARGWNSVRWITAEDNTRARTLYDRLAISTSWVTYELKLEPTR